MKIIRVFPRKTKATPIDDYAFCAQGPDLFVPECREVHISVTFKEDIRDAEIWAKDWSYIGVSVKIGGVAYGDAGGEFEPGMYLKKGYVITSRGCPNHCWFCSVPSREGNIRELQIKEGNNLLDNNILACSEKHIRAVFAMLKKQRGAKKLTGGLEAKRLQKWHCDLIADLKPQVMYFAYDTPDDYEPLIEAKKLMDSSGVSKSSRYCYVLIGYKGDTIDRAEKRLMDTLKAGYMPYAMLFNNQETSWKKFQREWLRPAIIRHKT